MRAHELFGSEARKGGGVLRRPGGRVVAAVCRWIAAAYAGLRRRRAPQDRVRLRARFGEAGSRDAADVYLGTENPSVRRLAGRGPCVDGTPVQCRDGDLVASVKQGVARRFSRECASLGAGHKSVPQRSASGSTRGRHY